MIELEQKYGCSNEYFRSLLQDLDVPEGKRNWNSIIQYYLIATKYIEVRWRKKSSSFYDGYEFAVKIGSNPKRRFEFQTKWRWLGEFLERFIGQGKKVPITKNRYYRDYKGYTLELDDFKGKQLEDFHLVEIEFEDLEDMTHFEATNNLNGLKPFEIQFSNKDLFKDINGGNRYSYEYDR